MNKLSTNVIDEINKIIQSDDDNNNEGLRVLSNHATSL